ncbi:MAG: oxygenase MpaB family protein [Novosphingobium meiothermophilum]|uniref:oxygenase MpaB family protein n=1 Tax=Novosphingobium TaxID=165696 RepID=UPI000D6E1CFE|nr:MULTISPECIES: oxygenase MpaB family protein [Novosphingobium]
MHSLDDLRRKVESQKTGNPAMYGGIDFAARPERLLPHDPTGGQAHLSELRGRFAADAPRLLENRELMGRMALYTMLGDTVADPYAALMPQRGFRPLVEMLVRACDEGVEAVTEAPPELVRFIRAMEDTPPWVDMTLIERGARIQRNAMANFAPWAIRGGFIATFMNKYAALPMALTGTLSHKTAARRIKETATFFATSTLPGALRRDGAGFKAAAMVRLMHSMVRFNVLSQGRWDQTVYGIPIPQVDQMPAGLIGDFFLSSGALQQGRSTFNADERAQVELSRYRCFLLGLPQDLLGDNPRDVVDLWNARMLSLRRGFDPQTCGALLKATMQARLGDTSTPAGALRERFERSFSKIYFLQNFCDGRDERAKAFGVPISAVDKARAAVVGAHVFGRMRAYTAAAKVPVLGAIADRRLTARLRRYLGTLGHAEFTSDAAQYRPAPLKGEAATV